MKYIIKAGVLYTDGKISAHIKGELGSQEKKIFLADGTLALRTDIRQLEPPMGMSGDIRFRHYVMFDACGREYVLGKPDYAKEDDPQNIGWPVCRMPRVDHVQILFGEDVYELVMKNSQTYTLSDKSGKAVIQIFHRGLTGGWNVEAEDCFSPEVVCGIFIFCRYTEQENEFFVV